jgi:hypothetical protein
MQIIVSGCGILLLAAFSSRHALPLRVPKGERKNGNSRNRRRGPLVGAGCDEVPRSRRGQGLQDMGIFGRAGFRGR